VPKRIDLDDDMPRRRRRGANAVAIEASEERNLAMRILLHSPKDLIAGALAFAAVSAIVANATFIAGGASSLADVRAPPSAFPWRRPIHCRGRGPSKPRCGRPMSSLLKSGPAEVRPTEMKPGASVSVIAKTNAAPVASASVARPPAPIPVSSRSDPVGDLIIASRRVAAVQRALTDYG